jgi:hypothetical protein
MQDGDQEHAMRNVAAELGEPPEHVSSGGGDSETG